MTSMKDELVLPGGFRERSRWLRVGSFGRCWYWLKGLYRFVRIGSLATRFLGPQYRRSRDKIEIDITYRCNLRCLNCNRSVGRTREELDIGVDDIGRFVEESLRRGVHWRRIRVLGGEPTLHPKFGEIIGLLRDYRQAGNPCSIEVVSNGYGDEVKGKLDELPADIFVENSKKEPGWQDGFRPFAEAPADDEKYAHAVFENGCEIASVCGMGLTPLGYYPCALAGGIDRVLQKQRGRSELPEHDDDMTDVLAWACRLCGRFKDGHHIPREFVEPLKCERISPSWQEIYRQWGEGRGRDGESCE